MAAFNWKTFTTRVPVNAPVKKLYECWATQQGIEYWFLRLGEFKKNDGALRNNNELVQTGDTYRWRWYGWPDEVTEEGSILECNGTNFFKFSFGKAGICTVTIKNEQGQNMVELLQEEIPDNEEGKHYWHVGCKTGWTFYLTNLKSLLEGGIDLRNRNESLQNVVNS